MDVDITKIKNPRKEADKHYYNPDNQNLRNLGYEPATDFEDEIKKLITGIKPYKKRISKYSQILDPTIKW
jgi:nucleoside-diphosphate-sugar epimerase